MKFSRDKCQVLNPGWNNPKQKHQLGTGWLDSCSAEKAQGALADSRRNMSQPSILAAMTDNSILGWISETVAGRWRDVMWRDVIFLFSSSWNTLFSFFLPSSRDIENLEMVQRGPKRLGEWRTVWKNDFHLLRLQRGRFSVGKSNHCLPHVFTSMYCDMRKSNGQNWLLGKF